MTRKRSKRPPHPKPVCRICKGTEGPWTEEDAYPKWLRKRIHEWLRALPPEMPAPPGWEQGRRILLKPVCQPCQRRLNELFEVPAHGVLQEMMDGSVVALSPQQQITIAAWAVKTTLVLGLAKTGNLELAEKPRTYLLQMLEGGTPPPNATARIAYLSDGLEESSGGFVPPGWPAALAPYEIEATICMPGLVCETITSPSPAIASFIEATQHDERFIVVWPPQVASVIWPPRIPLSLLDPITLKEEWEYSASPYAITSEGTIIPLPEPPEQGA